MVLNLKHSKANRKWTKSQDNASVSTFQSDELLPIVTNEARKWNRAQNRIFHQILAEIFQIQFICEQRWKVGGHSIIIALQCIVEVKSTTISSVLLTIYDKLNRICFFFCDNRNNSSPKKHILKDKAKEIMENVELSHRSACFCVHSLLLLKRTNSSEARNFRLHKCNV